jgi:DnaJ-class molecular chaperone
MSNQQGTPPRRVRCPQCNGSGQQANPVKCLTCNGTGRRLLVSENGFESGYRRSESYVWCIYCSGSGQAAFAPPVIQCKLCHGKGEGLAIAGYVQCPGCHGSGQTTIPDGTYVSGLPRVRAIPCPNCGGRRVVNGFIFQAAR